MTVKNKRILVTGGAGFIGSHLVDRLIDDEPESIVVATNYFLGKKENLENALQIFENLEIKVIDVSNYDQLEAAMLEDSFDVVFNLAVIPLPTSLEKPEFTFQSNETMTLNLCRLARNDVYESLMHFSSSEAYGSAQYVPMDENHPLLPCTPYAASKAATDLLVMSYHNTFGIDVSIIRPFNQYGPRQNWGRYAGLIPLTIKKILNNEELVIFGDGLQTRDYLYVTETADAAVSIYNTQATRGKIVNIASGNEITINDIVRLISSYFNYDRAVVHVEPRLGDVKRHFADISLAKSLINFEPNIDMEKGINMTCNWYEHVLHSGREYTS